MMKKTTAINIMVTAETKKRLQQKARELGLSLTQYIEKVGDEPIVFLDDNVKKLLKMIKFSM